MKKYILVFAAVIVFLCACTNNEKIARTTAEAFLESYYSLDYQTAETFCTPECAHLIEISITGMEELPEYIREKIEEASRETSYEIVNVDAETIEGEAVVKYRLHSFGLDKPFDKELRLKVEGDSAFVYAIK